ncbi:MAG: aminopeptidase P family N-terminal domain-containing protein [Anaerolineae bacterium]
MDTFQLKISEAEHRQRCERLLENVLAAGCSGVVLFDRDYIIYYTGFAFIPTERPIAFVMNAKGERGLFVPRIEVEHAQANALIDSVAHYVEYPDDPHPMTALSHLLAELGVSGKVASDDDGYPRIFGYRGPLLVELGDITRVPIRDAVEDQMMIKSPAELALLRESLHWANLALRLLQRYTKPGLTETEVERRAGDEATLAMVDAIGPVYRGLSMVTAGAYAIYRGQIGRNASIPHALANNITFEVGDVLVGESTAPMWGYISELERTMFIGAPSDGQSACSTTCCCKRRRSGPPRPPQPAPMWIARCAPITSSVDLTANWRHHTGHALICAITKDRSSTGAIQRRSSREWCSPSSRAVLARTRRLPSLRHGGGQRGWHRDDDVLPARPCQPDDHGLRRYGQAARPPPVAGHPDLLRHHAVAFLIMMLAPGDPIQLITFSPRRDPASIASLRHDLDRSADRDAVRLLAGRQRLGADGRRRHDVARAWGCCAATSVSRSKYKQPVPADRRAHPGDAAADLHGAHRRLRAGRRARRDRSRLPQDVDRRGGAHHHGTWQRRARFLARLDSDHRL